MQVMWGKYRQLSFFWPLLGSLPVHTIRKHTESEKIEIKVHKSKQNIAQI